MIEHLERRQLLASIGTIGVAPPDCGCGQQVKTTPKITTPITAPSTVTTINKGQIGTKTIGGKLGGANPPYNVANRWTTNANGSTGTFGSGITLTWSVMPDGTSIPGGLGEATSGSVFVADMNAIYGSSSNWLPILTATFAEWSAVTGITYVYESHDDGAELSDIDSGVLGTRGDIRIGAHPIDGANADTLAYTYYPNNGDMVVDANELTGIGYLTDTSSSSLRLRNVFSHEAGHGFGLDHVCPVNNTKLMEPFVSLNFDGPQFDDILAGNRLYGDIYEKGSGNNSAASAVDRGTITTGDNINSASISTISDNDYYKFAISASQTLNVTLSPVGTTYLSGTQNEDGSCSGGTSFNAMAQSNLQMQLIASNGTTVLFTANANGTGAGESFSNLALSAGTYYLKVSDASGSPNAAQMYSLGYTVSAPTVTATFTAVSTPRQTSVTSITITFSEAVSGFDTGDLTLTRDGYSVSLSTATLNTSDNKIYTLGNLSSLTDRLGQYALAFIASGTGIVGLSSGGAFGSANTDTWLMNALLGTSGDDFLSIQRNPANSMLGDVYYNSGSATYSYIIANLSSMVISSGTGDDQVYIDFTNGNMLPAGGASVDGGSHSVTGDTLGVIGQTGGDFFNFSSTGITRTSPSTISFSYTNIETLDFTDGTFNASSDVGSAHSVSVNVSTIVQFSATQHLNGLTVNSGGLVNMLQDGNRVAVVQALSLAGSGTVDLFDNDMIIDYTSSSPLASVGTWIRTARATGNWSGFGLTSNTAKTNVKKITTLGALEALDWKNLSSFNTAFDGEAIDNTAVLIKYTYYGDANLNGKVDGGDYSRVDGTFNKEHTAGNIGGWLNGDFDFNGKVDGGDYGLLDNAFNTQSGVL